MQHSYVRGWRRYMVGLALLGSMGHACAAGCQLLQIAQFHVEMLGNTPLVEAMINGQAVRLVVDSGSERTMLTRPAAEALHLKVRPIARTAFGVGGGDNVGEVQVQDFTLGSYTVHGLRLEASSHMKLPPSVVGLLGGDLLARTDVEFDLGEGAVRMFDPKGCSGEQVVYWRQPYSVVPIESTLRDVLHLQAYVNLNGKRTLALFDTGASVSLVTPHAARAAEVTIESPGVVADGQVHGLGSAAVDAYSALFPTVTIGDEKIANARLEIADIMGWRKEAEIGSHIPTAVTADFNPQMLLGADFFRANRIYVARSQGLIYFSYLGGPIFTDPRKRDPAPAEPTPPSQTTPADSGTDPH